MESVIIPSPVELGVMSGTAWMLLMLLVFALLVVGAMLAVYFFTRPQPYAYNGKNCVLDAEGIYVSKISCENREEQDLEQYFTFNGVQCVEDEQGEFVSLDACNSFGKNRASFNGIKCAEDRMGGYVNMPACIAHDRTFFTCDGSACIESTTGEYFEREPCEKACRELNNV